MNLLDALLALLLLSAVIGGYRLGFVARVASWMGLGLGLFVGARLAPVVAAALQGSDPAMRLILVAVTFLGGAALGAAVGEVLGVQVRRILPIGTRSVDRVAGAGAGVLGSLVLIWVLVPTLADVPGEVARQARGSTIARTVDDITPSPPDTLQALRRLVGEEGFPQVFEDLRPAPDTGPPPSESALSAPVRSRVVASTVKVSGVACRKLQQGSGFAAAPDTVVTNAHVVAGISRPEVLRPDGRRLRGDVVVYDANRDLAVIRVPNLGQSPLPMGTARVGDQGAVFGHPLGQNPVREAPARIQRQVTAVGRDIYGTRVTRREVYFLAASLQPGDSGAPLVDREGTVVGVAFAVAPDRPATAYAVTNDELRAVLAAPKTAPNAGRCLA